MRPLMHYWADTITMCAYKIFELEKLKPNVNVSLDPHISNDVAFYVHYTNSLYVSPKVYHKYIKLKEIK
jgi:hypothetical protein